MRNWLPFFDLHTGEDQKDRVLENVKSGISFRGANAWILACAIVIASVDGQNFQYLTNPADMGVFPDVDANSGRIVYNTDAGDNHNS